MKSKVVNSFNNQFDVKTFQDDTVYNVHTVIFHGFATLDEGERRQKREEVKK